MLATAEPVVSRRLLQRLNLPGRRGAYAASPYTGCSHFDADRPGEQQLAPKENAPEQFERDLDTLAVPPELLIVGAHCEPCPPVEAGLGLTRRLLQVATARGIPVELWTRSPIALDAAGDARPGLVTVFMGLCTLGAGVAGRIEPSAADPLDRLMTLARLTAAGYQTGLMLAPVIPGVNDGEAVLRDVIEAAAASGASRLLPLLPDLEPGSLEWTMPNVRALQPALNPRSQRRYTGPWPAARFTAAVVEFIEHTAREAGLEVMRQPPPRPPHGQLGLGI